MPPGTPARDSSDRVIWNGKTHLKGGQHLLKPPRRRSKGSSCALHGLPLHCLPSVLASLLPCRYWQLCCFCSCRKSRTSEPSFLSLPVDTEDQKFSRNPPDPQHHCINWSNKHPFNTYSMMFCCSKEHWLIHTCLLFQMSKKSKNY